MTSLLPQAAPESDALQEFRFYLSEGSQVPKPPITLQQILACSQDSESNAEKLATIIATDAAVAAHILKTVNSAYYGFPQQIASIKHAIVLLGFSEITNLAVGLSLMGIMTPRQAKPFHHQFQLHSLATARLALLLAEKLDFKEKSTAFTGGLLHDLGLLMLYSWQPEKYQQVLARCRTGQQFTFQVEREILGLDHMTAGYLVGHLWHLPEPLKISMRHHHGHPDDKACVFTAIIHLAHVLCYQAGFPLAPNLRHPRLPKTVFQTLQNAQPQLTPGLVKTWVTSIKPQLAQLPARGR
ncbi:MAG: HDOD domain-containing protein [Deltaproteobacteria bacterium]|nr:HDOD domain-containing protein [Candidatus Anaeroferrophillus wilburensis]MBN2888475.1 HDOD domain-containing protein [Deltaproteobacteria bacterium]